METEHTWWGGEDDGAHLEGVMEMKHTWWGSEDDGTLGGVVEMGHTWWGNGDKTLLVFTPESAAEEQLHFS
ncbi:hypothetical protein WISP_29092 [Willisornis vidua]|uniref:Uncharacterized protein n=1 Tax=Willisornis vidua TaxID=1566151 RepID=A0ABQ9DQ74_9PASS|nr:hypothetical protein WISP_29092 [Willisornis vidua]